MNVDPVGARRTFCRFCPGTCGLIVDVGPDGEPVAVRGDRDHPLSRGFTCERGRALPRWHRHELRLNQPRLGRRVTDWDTCLADLVRKIEAIRAEGGPDAVALYVGTAGGCDAAGAFLANRFLKAVGSARRYTTLTVDNPCKPFVAEQMTGSAAVLPLPDLEVVDLLVLVGTNPAVSHGHTAVISPPAAVLRGVRARGAVWVVDPRVTETARLATRQIRPVPSTDFAILGHLVRELLIEGADRAYLHAHASGVSELEEAVEPFTADRAAQLSGVPGADLADLVAAARRCRSLAVVTGTGVTMASTANVTEWLAWVLNIVKGSTGERTRGVWFNPGFLTRLDLRRASGAGVPPAEGYLARLRERPCAELAEDITARRVRAVLVLGGNPLVAFPDARAVRKALESLEVLAVADVLETPLVDMASHVLPCTGQLERADIAAYLDRYYPEVLTLVTSAMTPPAHMRRPAWWIFARLGELLGAGLLPNGLSPDACTDGDVLAEVGRRASISADQVVSGPRVLRAPGPRYGWMENAILREARWQLAPEVFRTGLMKLVSVGRHEASSSPTLTVRRQESHVNSQLTQVGDVTERDARVFISASDAAAWNIGPDSLVCVQTEVGSVEGRARIDPTLPAGVVSIPHGFSDMNASTVISAASVDRVTGMPTQTALPVEVRAVEDGQRS